MTTVFEEPSTPEREHFGCYFTPFFHLTSCFLSHTIRCIALDFGTTEAKDRSWRRQRGWSGAHPLFRIQSQRWPTIRT